MKKNMIEFVQQEAIARFPNSKSRQEDFVRSWAGIVARLKGRHMQKSDVMYGRRRRKKFPFPITLVGMTADAR